MKGHPAELDALGISLNDWFKLPLYLRQRYWQQTEFGEKPVPKDLEAAITTFLDAAPAQRPSRRVP